MLAFAAQTLCDALSQFGAALVTCLIAPLKVVLRAEAESTDNYAAVS